MGLSREEQLGLVARNIEEWGGAEHLACWKEGVQFSIFPMQRYMFTRSEVETKRREITGKPNDKGAPEWAGWTAQDKDGRWFWYEEKPEKDSCHFDPIGNHELAGEGEVLGEWRDTSKKINRDKKEVNEVERVEFLNGEKYHHESGFTGRFIGIDPCNGNFGVFLPESLHEPYVGYLLDEMKPLPSKRDKFVGSVLCFFDDKFPDTAASDCTVALSGMIFDAIAEGRLKAPEVKKND